MRWMDIVCSEFGFGGWLKLTAVEKTDQNSGKVSKWVAGLLEARNDKRLLGAVSVLMIRGEIDFVLFRIDYKMKAI
jgi:hypothetical protein